MRLTLDEKKFIVETHKAFNSHTVLMRRFKGHFKKKHVSAPITVRRIIDKLAKTGSVQNLTSTGRPRTARTEAKIKSRSCTKKISLRARRFEKICIALDEAYFHLNEVDGSIKMKIGNYNTLLFE